jgi:4-amino-4-deoxy-L-arabinose transferase-like glycosyltransferase
MTFAVLSRTSSPTQVAADKFRGYGATVPKRRALPALVLVLCLLSLAIGIDTGLWEPFEQRFAELSRRIALNLFGAVELTLPSADNRVPVKSELGKGELPFLSTALAMRALGAAPWAARLPLWLWSALGVVGVYAALVRLLGRRAALYGSLALVTTPAFFLQARSLLGDAATFGSFALAWSGATAAVFGTQLPIRARLAFVTLGALGLGAGFWCRGALLSVAVPACSVALAPLLLRFPLDALARRLVLGLSVLGVVAAVWGGLSVCAERASGAYSIALGSALSPPLRGTSFDAPLSMLLHGAFPWSALLPVTAAIALSRQRDRRDIATGMAASALLSLSLCFACVSWLSEFVAGLPFVALPCLSVLIALSFGELERSDTGEGVALAGFASAALALLLALDLSRYPDKSLVGFVLPTATAPEGAHELGARFWLAAGAVLASATALLLYERGAPERTPNAEEYVALAQKLKLAWSGNLVLGALLVESLSLGVLICSELGARLPLVSALQLLVGFPRLLARLVAVALPVAVLAPFALMLLRDTCRAVCAPHASQTSLRPTRSQALFGCAVAIGAAASFGYYPELLRQLPRSAPFRASLDEGAFAYGAGLQRRFNTRLAISSREFAHSGSALVRVGASSSTHPPSQASHPSELFSVTAQAHGARADP